MSTRCPWVVGSAWCPAKRYSASPSLIALLRTVFHALGRVNPSPEFAGGHDAHLSFSSKPMLKLFIKSLCQFLPFLGLFHPQRVSQLARYDARRSREGMDQDGAPSADARARRGARRHRLRGPQRESLQDAASGWSVSSFQQ